MLVRSIFPILIAVGLVGICFGQGAESSPKQAPLGHIQAQVRGRLVVKDSRYRVVVRLQAEPKKELVLDLWISENKILARQLAELQGKDVEVTGRMVWVPKGAQIQSDDDYTLGFQQFEIKNVEEQ